MPYMGNRIMNAIRLEEEKGDTGSEGGGGKGIVGVSGREPGRGLLRSRQTSVFASASTTMKGCTGRL